MKNIWIVKSPNIDALACGASRSRTNIRDICKEIIDMGIYQLDPDYIQLWIDNFTDV